MAATTSWYDDASSPGNRHLATALPAPADTGLSMAEAQRLQRYHDRLLCAIAARDRAALREAKQGILQAAYWPAAASAGSPAWRRAVRTLSWQMAALLLPRRRH
ncbi:hypothetical protein [Paracidovorax valerianellae]|uniref:Uncharacterized protein n=1 Tax=Paracidovorax valerianellae TaxID=187868 RepID=A0A1G7DZR6_9BURK|nr:hypothetical protein [Paracidovorax valerianellae]MDA8444557.1 hypothetical protein [Paracidovorax valerianellae]SDE56973.1 hypothetical protein SAMN05192589_12129 [Paracidovorax valerianellae]